MAAGSVAAASHRRRFVRLKKTRDPLLECSVWIARFTRRGIDLCNLRRIRGNVFIATVSQLVLGLSSLRQDVVVLSLCVIH